LATVRMEGGRGNASRVPANMMISLLREKRRPFSKIVDKNN